MSKNSNILCKWNYDSQHFQLFTSIKSSRSNAFIKKEHRVYRKTPVQKSIFDICVDYIVHFFVSSQPTLDSFYSEQIYISNFTSHCVVLEHLKQGWAF